MHINASATQIWMEHSIVFWQCRQVRFLFSVQLYKNLRVVYYPVGGLPFTKDNCGDTAKGGMPT